MMNRKIRKKISLFLLICFAMTHLQSSAMPLCQYKFDNSVSQQTAPSKIPCHTSSEEKQKNSTDRCSHCSACHVLCFSLLDSNVPYPFFSQTNEAILSFPKTLSSVFYLPVYPPPRLI